VVLEYCLGNWEDFVRRAKREAGAFNLPEKPTLGFLVKFVGIAVTDWQAESAEIARRAERAAERAKAARTPVQSVAAPAPPRAPAERRATKEEVFASLGIKEFKP